MLEAETFPSLPGLGKTCQKIFIRSVLRNSADFREMHHSGRAGAPLFRRHVAFRANFGVKDQPDGWAMESSLGAPEVHVGRSLLKTSKNRGMA